MNKNRELRNCMSTHIKANDDMIEICKSDDPPDYIVTRILLKCYNSNHSIKRILENIKGE